jgi:hypothetical protein
MIVHGRKLYPETLTERRLLNTLGGVPLRVPRGVSPYLVARRLSRAAKAEHPDVVFVKTLFTDKKRHNGSTGKGALPATPAATDNNAARLSTSDSPPVVTRRGVTQYAICSGKVANAQTCVAA